MSITQVNGFQCKTCTDIDYAKKHIDPSHPKDGPYGVNAKDDPLRPDRSRRDPAIAFGGALQGLADRPGASRPDPARTIQAGSLLNVAV